MVHELQKPDDQYAGHYLARFRKPFSPRKFFLLTEAFAEWGGFGPSPSQAATDPSATPTFDSLIKRGSQAVRTDRPTTTTTTTTMEDEAPPPQAEEPHKPFNHDFDEPVHSTETQAPVSSLAGDPPTQPQSLLTMQREGKRLSRKQKALLQAAAISRTPLSDHGEKASAETKEEQEEAEGASEPRMDTDEEKKQFQNRVWNLVKSKWL